MTSLLKDRKLDLAWKLTRLFAASALMLLVATGPAAATHHLLIVLDQGFNLDDNYPMPHVACRNADAPAGTPAYARAHMDLGALNSLVRYKYWKCYSPSFHYASQLSVPPAVGEVIEHKVHGVSDGFNPTVTIETDSYEVNAVSCRDLTQGGWVAMATSPSSAAGSMETWQCDFGLSIPATEDSILMIIQGTYR